MIRTLHVLALALTLALTLPLTLPAAARELTAAETSAIGARVEAFDAAVRANDFPAVIGFVPPRMFETIAAKNGIAVGKLREAVAEQMASIFEGVSLESFAIDVARAERRELPDGSPYLLMPTTTVLKVPGSRVQFDTKTLALEEGGTWYLVRLDDPDQIDVLRRAYPAFANETFPLGASRTLPRN